VWRGTDVLLNRPVAVKILRAEFAREAEALARFRDEARHAAALTHEGIARIYDYEEPGDDPPFLVMEYVDGRSVAELLTGEPLETGLVMGIVAQAAAALAAAHEAGLIHRDVSPRNILLNREGEVKLTDFGISRALGAVPRTGTGPVLGTAGYLAPERAAGGHGSVASDLYALGVVACECLTGQRLPPGHGSGPAAAAVRWRTALAARKPALPDGVVTLVSELMADEAAARPGTAAEVARRAGELREELTAGTSAAPEAQGPAAEWRVWSRPRCAGGRTAPRRPPTPVPSRPPGSRRRRPGRVLLSTAALGAILIAWAAVFVLNPANQRPSVAAPAHPTLVRVRSAALKGLPVAAARRRLEQHGLTVRVRWRPTQQVAAGRVLSVRPAGWVTRGSQVVVTGSEQPASRAGRQAPASPGGSRHERPSQPPTATPSPRPTASRSRSPGPGPSSSPSPTPTSSGTPKSSPTPTPDPSPSASSTPAGHSPSPAGASSGPAGVSPFRRWHTSHQDAPP